MQISSLSPSYNQVPSYIACIQVLGIFYYKITNYDL